MGDLVEQAGFAFYHLNHIVAIGMQKHPTIIVGAGAAGLAACHALLAAGQDALVLEASARIGGRIRALEGFADFPIELGAEEVHGLDHCLGQLAGDLICHSSNSDFLRLDRHLIPWDVALGDSDVAKVAGFIAKVSEYAGEPCSVADLARRAGISARVWHYVVSRMGVEHGTTIERLGMSGFFGYEEGWERRENNRTVRGRYLDLLAPITKLVEPHVRCRAPVEAILWDSDAVQVRMQDGEELLAAGVIFTGSIAMLAAGSPAFFPGLGDDKLGALERVKMDVGLKIILRFRERFWPREMYFLHTDGIFPQFWASGKGRASATPVLTAFIGGAKAEALQGLDVVRLALDELDEMFGSKSATQQFENSHIADWGAEPFVRGLYSYGTPQASLADRFTLASSLGGRVFFAGEATDTEGQTGTVHGAMASGKRAAAEVLQLLGAAPRQKRG